MGQRYPQMERDFISVRNAIRAPRLKLAGLGLSRLIRVQNQFLRSGLLVLAYLRLLSPPGVPDEHAQETNAKLAGEFRLG